MRTRHFLGSRRIFVRLSLATTWIFVAFSCVYPVYGQATLRAGAATTNITPPLGELIVGGFNPLPADEVHDELHVRAIVLDDGKTSLAFAICDNVGIARDVLDAAKRDVEATTKIPIANQLFAATHTHSATSARSPDAMRPSDSLTNYQSFLARRIADAVRLAHKRLQPCKIGWGSVEEASPLNNRRWFVAQEKERRNPFGGVDQVRMNPAGAATLIRPAGLIDPELSFVSIQHLDGRPLALLANYSLHYVGGVPARTISADYFAVFAQRIQKYLAENHKELAQNSENSQFVAILTNGTSGDVNNINFTAREPSRPPFEKMNEVGDLLAKRVHAALASIDYHDKLSLDARASELTLAVRKPTQDMLKYAEAVLAKPETAEKFHAQERVYAERIRLQSTSPDTVSVPIQVLRIGKLAIPALPFEVFSETGLEIKQESPFPATFTIELANGSYGYLPTPRQHEFGGYETWLGTNKVEIDASTKIVSRILEHLKELSQ